ncbi:MAG: hypothetical protein LiPW31_209, partial [Microgenomates group bacterium LiPW_31]
WLKYQKLLNSLKNQNSKPGSGTVVNFVVDQGLILGYLVYADFVFAI